LQKGIDMDVEQFRVTLGEDVPPPGLDGCLLALWHVAKGNWDIAHGYAQNAATGEGSWVHGYIHRVEGNAGNARYWYDHAGREFRDPPPADEWAVIAATLLARPGADNT
ncbi:MAG: hypothetical protein ACC634_08015, partial [Hyphomicrobiales bacterium]